MTVVRGRHKQTCAIAQGFGSGRQFRIGKVPIPRYQHQIRSRPIELQSLFSRIVAKRGTSKQQHRRSRKFGGDDVDCRGSGKDDFPFSDRQSDGVQHTRELSWRMLCVVGHDNKTVPYLLQKPVGVGQGSSSADQSSIEINQITPCGQSEFGQCQFLLSSLTCVLR